MTNAAYFAQREEVELALARAAASPKVRDIHLDLAKRYAILAKDQHPAEAAPSPGGMTPGGLTVESCTRA